jgi:hypothetical protein
VPFLKFSRDRRGYEHFAIVEPGVPRRGKPARQRLLFWFRTPPQVKVGRLPFTDEVRRAIEAQNPGIRFDWPRLLATPIPPPDVEHWRERRRVEKAFKQAAREAAVEDAAAADDAAEAEEAPEQAPGEPAPPDSPQESVVEGILQADALVEAEEAGEGLSADEAPGQTAAVSGTSQVGAGPGGHRRRRRGRRRRPHPSEPGSAPASAQTAQITPARPPTEEV